DKPKSNQEENAQTNYVEEPRA
ncbi:unnamed protein product, partial [Rotaria sp. Silwood1]